MSANLRMRNLFANRPLLLTGNYYLHHCIHVPVVEDFSNFLCKCAENCTEDKACLLAADVMVNETDDDANDMDASDDKTEQDYDFLYELNRFLHTQNPHLADSRAPVDEDVSPAPENTKNLDENEGESEVPEKRGPSNRGSMTRLGRSGATKGYMTRIGRSASGAPKTYMTRIGRTSSPKGYMTRIGRTSSPKGYMTRIGRTSSPKGYMTRIGRASSPKGYMTRIGRSVSAAANGAPKSSHTRTMMTRLGKRGIPDARFKYFWPAYAEKKEKKAVLEEEEGEEDEGYLRPSSLSRTWPSSWMLESFPRSGKSAETM
jgi:hypothetical protein